MHTRVNEYIKKTLSLLSSLSSLLGAAVGVAVILPCRLLAVVVVARRGVLSRPVCVDACPILSFCAVVVVVPPACQPRKQSLVAAVAVVVAGAAAVVVSHRPVLVLILSLLSGLAHSVHPASSCSQQRLAVVIVVVLSFPSCCCSSRDLSPCRLSVPSSTNDPPCEQLLAAVLAGVGSLTSWLPTHGTCMGSC